MEKIVEVKEFFDREGNDGFDIKTDKQTVSVFIDNEQQCCEKFGYFWCNDSYEEFVGAKLLDICISDEAINLVNYTNKKGGIALWDYEGGVMFVDFKTDRGVLQFVAYNEHNGYYGHRASVVSKQINYRDGL